MTNHGRIFAGRMCRQCASGIILLGLLVYGFAGDWPQWLGPKRNATAPDRVVPWKNGLPTLWRHPVGEGHSSPVIAAGRVFVHAKVPDHEQEEVVALHLKTGKVLWRQVYDRPKFENPFGNGPRSTPLVSPDGKLFTLGASGILCAWDAMTGKLLWRKDILSDYKAKNLFFGVSSSPLWVNLGDKPLVIVMVGAPEASLVALDAANGETVWKSGSDAASYSSPVLAEIGGRQFLIALTAQHLVAAEPDTGQWLATFPFVDKLSETASTPVVVGDQVFISSITGGSVLLRLQSQGDKWTWQEVWRHPQLHCYFSTPVVANKHLYLVTGQLLPPLAVLRCVDWASGKILWSRDGAGQWVGKYHASLLLADDKLLVLQEDGTLLLLEPSPEGYKELARASVCGQTWAHPALSDHLLVVRDAKEVRCIPLPKP
ncbi:MAG: PQQ-binding-like beta-propeller repeat protein [Gemmatales bacterium]|nr:PQQ-like beta-propeller repeat protein [Gemmatales bacterium]MDW7994270.1 PQQ-binding-like beta-propeller repeat protein [Gemmatales bacterium]